MKKIILIGLMLVIAGVFMTMTGCSKTEKTKAHVAHILIMYKGSLRAPESITRTQEEAKAFAEALMVKVKAGEDFAELARENSDCPSRARGGDLSTFEKGVMDKNFEDAAFKLKKDQISDIVETNFGYHIIKGLE